MSEDSTTIPIGSAGESEAAAFLIGQGYKILERNYRKRMGEIDIIAQHQKTLCFIEVKTRQSHSHGSPLEAVTKQKQRQIIRLSLYYLKENNIADPQVRFDVVTIDRALGCGDQIKLTQNAFDASPA